MVNYLRCKNQKGATSSTTMHIFRHDQTRKLIIFCLRKKVTPLNAKTQLIYNILYPVVTYLNRYYYIIHKQLFSAGISVIFQYQNRCIYNILLTNKNVTTMNIIRLSSVVPCGNNTTKIYSSPERSQLQGE